jgi:hypothetical protein
MYRLSQLVAGTPDGGWVASDEGDCACGVGSNRRQDEHQQGKRYQPATTGQRVDRSPYDRGYKE